VLFVLFQEKNPKPRGLFAKLPFVFNLKLLRGLPLADGLATSCSPLWPPR
jgi:hypothetical protein